MVSRLPLPPDLHLGSGQRHRHFPVVHTTYADRDDPLALDAAEAGGLIAGDHAGLPVAHRRLALIWPVFESALGDDDSVAQPFRLPPLPAVAGRR
jgi:hypothetical protein